MGAQGPDLKKKKKKKNLAGGSWLSQVKRTDPPSLMARMTRAILGMHRSASTSAASILTSLTGVSCDGAPLQTRNHVLYQCPRRDDDAASGREWLLPTLLKFLRAHPWAFASGPRDGVG